MDGDGIVDILISAKEESSPSPVPSYTGAVYVYSGADRSLLRKFSGTGYQNFGAWTEAVGDINQDGFDNILIGASYTNANGLTKSGQVKVYSLNPIPPTLSILGSCPGPMTISISGAQPFARVALFMGNPGSSILSNDFCNLLELDLDNPTVVDSAVADAQGNINLTKVASNRACGIAIQAVDLLRCSPSNVEILP